MFLAIDAGNTQTTFGLFEEGKIKSTFRLSTKDILDKDVFASLLNGSLKSLNLETSKIREIGISSVVPSVDHNLKYILEKLFNTSPFFISPEINLPFKLLVDNPSEVGADRICNVAAGFEKYGGPLVIVDFGTATVYDVISKNGDFLGGIIAPGILTSAKALFLAAEKLPEVELIFPEKVIGTNTISNMQAGIMFGALDSFEGMIRRIQKELNDQVKVIATGGFSKTIYTKTNMIYAIEFDLVLEGIKILYDKCYKKL